MSYLPTQPDLREERQQSLDDRRRRRIARMIGGGTAAAVALLVGFGAWNHATTRAETVAVLDAQKSAVPVVRTMTAQVETGLRVEVGTRSYGRCPAILKRTAFTMVPRPAAAPSSPAPPAPRLVTDAAAQY
jgi:hypothetical protein